MKKCIVTGANGFVGTALLEEMSKKAITVYAIIRDEQEDIETIKKFKNVRIVYCDLNNIEKLPDLIQDRDIDVFIHLGWCGSTGDMRADYELQLANVKYSMDAVNVAYLMNISRFVGAGTLAEKDVLYYHPCAGATPNPVSIYGIAKISAHFMTKAECTKYGIDHIWCYLSNTYGEGNRTNNFINFASKLMLDGKRASFTAGEQMYDFLYVKDTARAILAAAEFGIKNKAYYLGSTAPRKLKEYIRVIRDAIDPKMELYLGEVPFNGVCLPDEEFDARDIVSDCGFAPEVTFEDGIKNTICWLKKEMGK